MSRFRVREAAGRAGRGAWGRLSGPDGLIRAVAAGADVGDPACAAASLGVRLGTDSFRLANVGLEHGEESTLLLPMWGDTGHDGKT